MKKVLAATLLVAFCITTSPVSANESEQELRLQLLAIMDYINYLLPQDVMSEQELKKTIDDGIEWTLRAQAKDGSFNYEYFPFEDEYSNDNGMVRQAGTLFMLSEVHKKRANKPDEEAQAIEKALAYFESVSAESDADDGEFLCIKNSTKSKRCDLGSTALALTGLINYVTAHPDKQNEYQELLDSYSSYLFAAKFPGKGFSSRYDTNYGFSDKESPFYNGETMLTLVRLYQLSPSEEVKEMVNEVFYHLSVREYESPLYLWIMAALKEMHQLWPSEAYVAYGLDFTEERLLSSYRRHGTTHNYCAPLEGLTSAYSLLEERAPEHTLNNLINEINYWQSRTTYLQLDDSNPYRLVFVDEVPQLLKTPNSYLAHGGFLTGTDQLTQRIDFTQHCVSSYLQKLVDIDKVEL